MASDNRDWYRDFWRKKTGYVERAPFRLPAIEVEGKKHFKLHPVWWVLLCAFAFLVLLNVVAFLLRM